MTTKTTLCIDGAQGEGGGQVLRSALTLAMLLQQPFEMHQIRAGRSKPGLLRQHLTCVQAAAAICQAEVQGAELGSTQLVFVPGPVRAGHYRFAIGSAGSTSLVLQTLLLPLAFCGAPSVVEIDGGTHNGLSPSTDFLQHSFLPVLKKMGLVAQLSLERFGFYPAGGGKVVMNIEPVPFLQPVWLTEPAVAQPHLTAICSGIASGIGQRELQTAASLLGLVAPGGNVLEVLSCGPGNMLQIRMPQADDFSLQFEVVGVRGLSAAAVAQRAVAAFKNWHLSGAAVEEYLADQLLLPLAVAGGGGFTCSNLSLHCRTNMEVIRQFGLADFTLHQLAADCWEIQLQAGSSGSACQARPTNTWHESADVLR